MDDGGPKWRLEHASNGLAGCQKAKCKRARAQIEKGELRIGTHSLFDNDEETRWYMAWRHWRCATKRQIAGLVETTGSDPTKAPGYEQLSSESQEQVRLAFESGGPVDKGFKGIREDLAKNLQNYAEEYTNAISYKIDVAFRATVCRGGDCLAKGIKITKGELRLGIWLPFDENHDTIVYKHWKCMSGFDLDRVKRHAAGGMLSDLDLLSKELEQVVARTLERG